MCCVVGIKWNYVVGFVVCLIVCLRFVWVMMFVVVVWSFVYV